MGIDLDMPNSAGEWIYTPIVRVENTIWYERGLPRQVTVTETPAAGRLCKSLRMGGSIHCGLAPWSGRWRKAA